MFLSWFYIDKCNTLMEALGHGVCVFRIEIIADEGYKLVALCSNRINNAIFTSGICTDIDTCVKQILDKLENAARIEEISFIPYMAPETR